MILKNALALVVTIGLGIPAQAAMQPAPVESRRRQSFWSMAAAGYTDIVVPTAAAAPAARQVDTGRGVRALQAFTLGPLAAAAGQTKS